MPESMSKERRALLRAFGAELVLTDPSKGIKGAVEAPRRSSRSAAASWPASSPTRPTRRSTAARRRGDLEGHRRRRRHRRGGHRHRRHDHRYRPGPQGAQARPAGRRRRAEGDPILNGGQPGPHKIQGIGANFVPEILDTSVYDEVIDVDIDTSVALRPPRRHREGLLVGLSSGAALAAAAQVAQAPGERGQDDRRHHPELRRALPLDGALRGSRRLTSASHGDIAGVSDVHDVRRRGSGRDGVPAALGARSRRPSRRPSRRSSRTSDAAIARATPRRSPGSRRSSPRRAFTRVGAPAGPPAVDRRAPAAGAAAVRS